MKIKLNNKKVKIKPFINLTVKEYIKFWELYEIEASKNKDGIPYLKVVLIYLTAITKYEFADLLNINIANLDILRIQGYIGQFVPVDKIPYKNHFWYKETGLCLHKFQNWQTVGTRLALQQKANTTENIIELTTYLLAIAIQNDYDHEKINEIYKKLLLYNAFDVLGFSYFFFRRLQNGTIQGKRFFQKLRKILNINIVI